MRFYTSPKFWISDFSNLSPADDVLMSFYVVFFKWFGLDYDRILCIAKFENSRWPWWSWDRISQWDFEIFDDFQRYETQIKVHYELDLVRKCVNLLKTIVREQLELIPRINWTKFLQNYWWVRLVDFGCAGDIQFDRARFNRG